ncbi:MAG TPA: phage tail protein [Pyrinomonadaceae bacterium]|jgi:phage tail-like protein|nr:phage tail protein [Pyrinomonadaceae bacterium]
MPRRAIDPFATFNYRVEIDGITIAGFSEVTGLNTETNVIDYREGTEEIHPRKLPGLNKFGNITLKKGISPDMQMYNWRKTVVDGDIERKNMSIILHNEKHDEVVRWNIINAWPSKYTAPDLKASANEVGIESVEIVHEGLERA